MYWIIEPHADDAYLSLHEHIIGPWQLKRKTIVTVFATRRRTREAEDYAKAVGCMHVSLEYLETPSLTADPSFLNPFSSWGIAVALDDTIVLPVGLQHPDHHSVAAVYTPVGVPVLYYLDSPYFMKQKLGLELEAKTKGRVIVSMRSVNARKWKHIARFKSQSKFFHFNQPESLPKLEIVIR